MQLILIIFGYFWITIRLAAVTLEALSDMMATNFLDPTHSITSIIMSDKFCTVWCSFERSLSQRRYSFLEEVRRRKAQMLLSRGSVHPSKANTSNIKIIN